MILDYIVGGSCTSAETEGFGRNLFEEGP